MEDIIELYNGGGFSLIISTKEAGPVGPSWDTVNPARRGLFQKIGISPESVFFVSQQHSRIVVDTAEHSFSPLTEADGIVSGRKDENIAVTVADCMPVYLQDQRRGVRALLHSGWKGTGIALNALRFMSEHYGSRAEDVTAVLGPSIGSCCYNVDDHRASLFASEWGACAVEVRDGINYISLREANRSMLENAGVKNIIASDFCTSCDSRLGSFRREGPENFTHMFVLSYLNDDR